MATDQTRPRHFGIVEGTRVELIESLGTIAEAGDLGTAKEAPNPIGVFKAALDNGSDVSLHYYEVRPVES